MVIQCFMFAATCVTARNGAVNMTSPATNHGGCENHPAPVRLAYESELGASLSGMTNDVRI